MKKYAKILACFILSVIVVSFTKDDGENQKLNTVVEASILRQEIIEYSSTAVTLNKLYNNKEFVGYIEDLSIIDQLLEYMYKEKYKEEFPDSKIQLGSDLFIVQEENYFLPKYDDSKIVEYIVDNNYISVEAQLIEFVTDEGTYDSLYVINKEIFEEAQNDFLKIFISAEALEAFSKNRELPELTEYGSREISAYLLQDIKVSKSLAYPENILRTKEEILEFLSYGGLKEKTLYTTVEGDTVLGVGALNGQMSAEQIVAINTAILKSPNQLLEPGTELNVTYFEPIVDVVVEKEVIVKEVVYPGATVYLEDSSLREGITRVETEYKEGSQNTKYIEKWVNGKLIGAEKISSELTSQPQTPVIYRGSKIIPGIGSGIFRAPVDNMVVSCGWYCYPNHRATDLVNRYERYAPVYSVDRGTVIISGYHPVNGNYIRIDHNNGYVTQYNHFVRPPYFPVGVNVDKGEVIGTMGETGTAFGVHLHLIVWENGSRINPCYKLGC